MLNVPYARAGLVDLLHESRDCHVLEILTLKYFHSPQNPDPYRQWIRSQVQRRRIRRYDSEKLRKLYQ